MKTSWLRSTVNAHDSRRRLGLVAGSLVLCLNRAMSLVPNNLARIAVLRLCGAHIGSGCAVNHGLRVSRPDRLVVGDDVYISEDVSLDGRGGLTIGSHVSIGVGAQIWTAQHDTDSPTFAYVSAPVVLGDCSWVSSRAIVLPGVTIGAGAVIGAGGVVPKDVPGWVIAVGVPVRVIRERAKVPDGYSLGAARNKIWWW